MSNRDPIDNLRHFVGRVCTVHTRPTNWKHDQQQSLDYFMGVVDSIDALGMMLTNVINRNKTYIFLEAIIAIAEETVIDPADPSQVKAAEEYEKKKAEIVKDNPSLQTSKPKPVAPPPPPPQSSCGGGCGSSSFMDIKNITQIAGQAREKLKS